jgi:hypothetical protein
MTDEEVMAAPESQLVTAALNGPFASMSTRSVNRISKGMSLARSYYILPSEVTTIKAVSRRTRIKVPRVHRFFTQYDDGDGKCGPFKSIGYLVTDHVDGIRLSKCWRNLNGDQHKDIVKQVVDIIRQLRQLKFSKPGPLSLGPSRGAWFSKPGAGPFTDTADFNAFFNRKIDCLRRHRKVPAHVPGYDFQEFVMTHQNISPENITLDRQDQLWLVNWSNAGAYPPIFELAALKVQKLDREFGWLVLEEMEHDQTELYHLMRLQHVMSQVDEEEVCCGVFGFPLIGSQLSRVIEWTNGRQERPAVDEETEDEETKRAHV